MTAATLVNTQDMQAADRPDLYDVGDIPDAAGDLVAGEPSSIREVAAALRREIYSGRYPAGSRFRTREDIADEHHVSSESAGVALRMLAADGLVTLEQGRGTFVCKLVDYAVTVAVEAPADTVPAAVISAADPAVRRIRFEDTGGSWRWVMTVRAAGPGRAAAAGVEAAEDAADGRVPDFTPALVSADPAQ